MSGAVLAGLVWTSCSSFSQTVALDAGDGVPLINGAAPDQCEPLMRYDFAFTSSASGNADLYIYRAIDRSISTLVNGPAQEHWATWSPDGQRIAFQTLRDGNREIYVLEIDGGNLRNVSEHAEQDQVPAWSPDGTWIAFASSRLKPWHGAGAIGGHHFLVHPDGSNLRRLDTADFYSTSGIAWAPDSKKIAYARFGEGRSGLYTFDIGSEVEALTLNIPGASPGIAAYAPSGDAIAYYLDRDDGADIYVLSLADKRSRRITSGAGYHYYASWSPDGSALLTTSSQDLDGRIYDIRCVALDGSYDVPVIDDSGDARAAAWRPANPTR